MNKEIFKDVPGYEGLYQVSNLGNVKSFKFGKERILKPGMTKRGYRLVVLRNLVAKTFPVSKLIAMAFLGHVPNGCKIVVDHINNIKTDDRLENLQLISHRENCSKDRDGLSKYTGVSWFKPRKKWRARIQINGKNYTIGYFTTEEEAAKAYKKELLSTC